MDNIIASMPEFTIPPLQGPPNLEYLTELNTYLNSCLASIHSNLGCGTLGHLPLTAPPAVYALLSATKFVVPTNPGSTVQLANLVGVGVCFPDTEIFGVFTCEG